MFRAWRCAATVIAALAVVTGHGRAAPQDGGPLAFSFTNVARDAGLDAVTTFGGTDANKYLLETTGTGVAFIDYDGDGLLDLFFVNGSTLDGFPAGKAPINHLYRNTGKGAFEDVTVKAVSRPAGGGRARVSATMTTTATTTCS